MIILLFLACASSDQEELDVVDLQIDAMQVESTSLEPASDTEILHSIEETRALHDALTTSLEAYVVLAKDDEAHPDLAAVAESVLNDFKFGFAATSVRSDGVGVQIVSMDPCPGVGMNAAATSCRGLLLYDFHVLEEAVPARYDPVSNLLWVNAKLKPDDGYSALAITHEVLMSWIAGSDEVATPRGSSVAQLHAYTLISALADLKSGGSYGRYMDELAGKVKAGEVPFVRPQNVTYVVFEQELYQQFPGKDEKSDIVSWSISTLATMDLNRRLIELENPPDKALRLADLHLNLLSEMTD